GQPRGGASRTGTPTPADRSRSSSGARVDGRGHRRGPGLTDQPRVGRLAVASPVTLTSPSWVTRVHSRSTRCAPSSLRLPLTLTLVTKVSPGQVCLAKRTR